VSLEESSARSARTTGTYIKWLNQDGAGEAYEHKNFVRLRHQLAGSRQQIGFDVSEATRWSYVFEPSDTTFIFQLSGVRVVTITAPSLVAAALLTSLKRKSAPHPWPERALAGSGKTPASGGSPVPGSAQPDQAPSVITSVFDGEEAI
jgi:hypothetical protein